MKIAFYSAPVIYYRDGFIYFGGLISPGERMNDINRFDAVTHVWTNLGYLKALGLRFS